MLLYKKDKIIRIIKLNNRIFSSQKKLYSHSNKNSLNLKVYNNHRLTYSNDGNSIQKIYRKFSDEKKEIKFFGSAHWRVWLSHASRMASFYEQASLAKLLGPLKFDLPKAVPDIKNLLYVFYTKQKDIKKHLEPNFKDKPQLKFEPQDKVAKLSISQALPETKKLLINETKDVPKLSNVQKKPLNESKFESPVKKNEGMLASASEAVVATFKNISNYLPMGSTASPQVKDLMVPKVMTLVDAKSGQTKVRVTWTETEREAIERNLQHLLEKLEDGDDVILELCKHLALFPSSASLAGKEPGLVEKLLKARQRGGYEVVQACNKAFRLLGHTDPLNNKGICLLSLDGGGTRGLVTLNVLKELERLAGRPIYELFNYVCGVSTGSLIGVMAFLLKLPLHQAERMYRHFSKKMFERNRLIGASKLVMTHAYYDTALWEEILRRNVGGSSFVDSMADCCHLSVVSTLMNASRVQNFLFRNYNLPPHRHSRYKGCVDHKLWEAVRASSAAPGYFEEFELNSHIHQDGGVLTNNPTAIAIHEAKLIWPEEPIQCIVSIGTGWHEESLRQSHETTKSSLKSKITKVIESATDTEGIHMVLNDFIPPPKYFRFNPCLSGSFELDETRDSQWRRMDHDVHFFCSRNRASLEAAASQLVRKKSRLEKAKRRLRDFIKNPF